MKDFRDEFYKFRDMVRDHKLFALSRCNDGEYIIMKGEYINLLNKCNGEFIYDPNNSDHTKYKDKLIESAQYTEEQYIVGIGCRCCLGDNDHEDLKKMINQDEDHLSFGNVFVNSNFPLFISEMLPLFSRDNMKIIIVTNEKANINNLPFFRNIVKHYKIGTNAWMNDYSLIDEMKKYIQDNNAENHIFLFCAGPFSNILIHECYKSNKNNEFIDLGSTLDTYLFGQNGYTRGYHCGAPTLQKICIW